MSLLASTQGQVDAIRLELMQRHEYAEGTDLTNVASVMLQLRETLPASYYKFMLTLSDVVLSKLSPEYCEVPVMTKKLEAALTALSRTFEKGRGSVPLEQPDRLFDKFASALSSMLRDVVPDHEKCVRDARGRAVQEAEAAEQVAAAQDKAAAKLAKKEKMRKEAAERKERLAAKAKKSDVQEERSSGDAAETGSTRAPESPTYPDAN